MVAQAISTIALALLAASGVSKALDPDPTRGALKAARLPSSSLTVVALGIVEVLAAVVGIAIGGWWLAPAAVLYLGFSGFTIAAVRGGIPVQSCGCFGREDTPPTVVHIVYNLSATFALGYLTVTARSAVPWSGTTVDVALFLAFSLIGGYLSYLVLARLPQTLALANRP